MSNITAAVLVELAERVHWWTAGKEILVQGQDIFFRSGNRWKPHRDIKQALELLEAWRLQKAALRSYDIKSPRGRDDEFFVITRDNDRHPVDIEHPRCRTLAEAIVRAVCAAEGIEEANQ